MSRRSLLLAFGFAILFALAGCSTTTVVLVRHAEKAGGQNPPLTPDGVLRAQALVEVIEDAGLSAIYTTQYLRTQQTAAPSESTTGIVATVIEVQPGAGQQHAEAVAAHILENHAGGWVLVVGHSDTVPLIIGALGGPPPSIGSTEFDRLFVILKRQNQSFARLVKSRYGPP